MTEARRANIIAIALAAAAMLLVGTVPAYSSNASSARDRVNDSVRVRTHQILAGRVRSPGSRSQRDALATRVASTQPY